MVPTGIVIGHVGIAAKILPRLPLLDLLSRWLAHGWAVALAADWALRVREAGHLPLLGTYESALSLALATMVAAVLWEHIGRRRVPITPLAALTAAALMSHGRHFDPTVYDLAISGQSWVVELHAVIAWSAFAVLAVNSFFALRLVLGRGDKPPVLERWLALSLELGFLLLTAMLASGSVCSFLFLGTAWSFDPVETLALVVWVSCGALLCLHRSAGWSGKRLARWCLVLFVALVFSYRAIVYLPPWSSYHVVETDRRSDVSAEELGPVGNHSDTEEE